VIGRSVVIVFVVIGYRLFFVIYFVIYLYSDLMMEWNSDEISKLIDFIEKISFMYDPSDASTMISAIFLVQETAMNLHQIFRASFWYQFLLRLSLALGRTLTCSIGRLSLTRSAQSFDSFILYNRDAQNGYLLSGYSFIG